MNNKILSVALMAVAAICIIAAPFALNSSKDDIPSAPAASDSALSDIDSISDSSEDSSAVVTTTPSVTTTAKNSSKTTTTAKAEETSAAEPTDPSGGQQPSGGGQSGGQSGGGQSIGGIQLPQVAALPAPTFASGTPAAIHGQLSVSGANIVDKSGQIYQIRGMSTHGVGWYPESISENTFRVLRDDWGCNTIRLAMYIEESWGGSESLYLAQPQRNMELVTKGIDACANLGMYVIVDWHVLNPGDPTTHTEDAKNFFSQIAQRYGNYPNIIYEICNEPHDGPDWNKVKGYAEQVIPVIRQYDSDAIIICGTPTWSQDIDQAANNRLSDSNTVYAFHFYAATHSGLKSRVIDCYNKGLPILVSEFGTCDATGNGAINASETNEWFNLLDERGIGYLNWSICNKNESASAFAGGTNLAAIQAGTSQLTESGRIVREHLRQRAGLQ